MNSITYIGLDVHTTNYTICAYTIENDKLFAETTVRPDIKELDKYLKRLKDLQGADTVFVCGYEAGCLGYSLYHQLKEKGYLVTLSQLMDKIERFDKRIEEFASQKSYAENAKKLQCLRGIKVHSAMSFLVEIGDSKRFPTSQQFSAFWGSSVERRNGFTYDY